MSDMVVRAELEETPSYYRNEDGVQCVEVRKRKEEERVVSARCDLVG
jgi:hypothetical protein